MKTMRTQWFTRSNRRPAGMAPLRPSRRLIDPKPVRDIQTGFIHHPSGFPLQLRRLWLEGWRPRRRDESREIGLIFDSEKYVPPGAVIEICIPMRTDFERFRGRVVLIRHNGQFHEIGISLLSREDANRLRIVEQICHIELYMQQKKYFEGPYCLDQERLAAEWIAKNASSVPT
jgi:hypothetical protein